MMRKEKVRQKNITIICNKLFKHTQMSYTILFHAEDIAEETLSEVVYINNIPIYSLGKDATCHIKNRRLLLRATRRKSELKPYRIVFKGSKVQLR